MQFQPTALILSASAQREHFDSVRLDTADAGISRWDFDEFDRAALDRAVLDRTVLDRAGVPATTRDHRLRRAVAGLLVRAAGVIEPQPGRRLAARS